MPAAPIKTQEEADQVMSYLITATANTLRIPVDEATRRIKALYKSGILEQGKGPADRNTQLAIDAFLSIPSSAYAHLG